MTPRILHLIDSFDQGGSERQGLQLIRLLRESGKFEVSLASLKPDGVLLADAGKLELGDIASYPLKNFYDRNAIAQLRKFVHHLRVSKIDVLHTHDFYTNIFGMVAGSLAGVKVRVASRRETGGMRSNAQRMAQQFTYWLAHHIVANSQSVRRQLIKEGVSPKRITVIHNGLEIERVMPPAGLSHDEALVALGIADAAKACTRFVTIVANMRHPVKDYSMFLRAAQQVSQALPNTGFLLAGEGELRPSIEQLAAQLGIGNNTFFLGRCENLGELLSISDVCVLSSKAEGFSNSILEYMAAGKPVVATNVGGASEAIREGDTGFLVASGDDSRMAERIIWLLRNPEKARLMGERGRQAVEEKFSQRALLQNTEALYEKLLHRRQADPKAAKAQPTGSTSDMTTDQQSEQPLRILVVGPSFDILGGQSVQAARLISRLRELSSFQVGFLPINPRLPGLLRKLQAVKYLRTVVTSFLYIATLLVRIPKYDVVHVFSASYFSFVLAPTPAIAIAKLFGKRVLLNYHSGEAEDHLRRWPSAVATIRRVDEVAVPSQYLVKVFAQFGLRAEAINNLIELDKFTFRARNPLKPVFLSNRNFESHYGVDRVLRAFARIQEQFPDAELIVAGEGMERGALETLAEELGLRNTKFVGRVEHDSIAALYQAADIYLNGSEVDNQPLSILEAFSCGLPVVTTDAGGIPDMVANGANGLVVSRGDHQALADRAIGLLADSQLSRSIVGRAREECENYSWDAVRDRWIKLYSDLASPSGTKGESVLQAGSRTQKLSRMSFDEIRVRGSQLWSTFAERQGWSSLTKLPGDQALVGLLDSTRRAHHKINSLEDFTEHFRSRNKPVLSAAFINATAPDEFQKRWPGAAHEILYEADRVVAGKFDLLGLRDLNFGDPISWNFEPVSGKSTPPLHWSLIDYLDPEIAGDKKILWELNRHQYFLKLGQAYWLSKDEKYADAFVAQLESWMDSNPPKLGINWASSLEIALRSISWLWALHLFKNSPSLTSTALKRALKFLYLNARHLETYISTYFSPNTHLTGEALGLFYLGTLLPEFREAERWRRTGRKILVEQLVHQVKTDGVYFEQSSYYHRYTTDFYMHFLILAQANGEAVPAVLAEKLTALLDHLMFITRPDGTTPLFGDDDGGRLITLDRRRSNDFRAALSTGAALFGRSDYKYVAGELAEETFWLLGTQGIQDFDRITAQAPAHQSKAFPAGGYYVMRDGWHQQANYLLFDCGPHGADNCGHAHADALAIEVTANGRAILIDPGTYTYTGSQELRNWFRGSRAHNVLLVDGQPSSVPAGPFSWKTIATCRPLSWISGRRFDFVAGRHNGYERLPEPVTHTRSILFLKNDYWVVRDSLVATGDHQVKLPFHFASDVNPQFDAADGHPHMLETCAGKGLQVAVFGKGRWSREEGWVSHSYGERVAAPVCVFSATSLGNGELITLLLPKAGKTSLPTKIREVEAIGGRAFEVVNEDHRDVVLLRDPNASRVETVRLISDFSWTWARFSQGGTGLPEELLEFVVLDGQRLELDCKEILKSGKHVDYLVASRIGNKFRLEMDERVLNLSLPVNNLESLFAEANRQSTMES